MATLTTIETCRHIMRSQDPTAQSQCYLPKSSELAPLIDKIPQISVETLTIFDRIIKQHYTKKAPTVSDLRREMTKFHKRVEQNDILKASKAGTFGNEASLLAYGIVAVALSILGFGTIAACASPVFPSAILGICLDSRVKSDHRSSIDFDTRMAALSGRYTARHTEKFARFFQDKKVVKILETDILNARLTMNGDSLQSKVYSRALQELEACRDFCTVYT